jgi:hypothetical protein
LCVFVPHGGLVVTFVASNTDPFALIRSVGLTLPGVEETIKYDGTPQLKVGGKFMAAIASHPSAEPGSLVVRADLDDRQLLLDEAPEIYYLTDSYRPHAVVLARLALLDRDALHDLLAVSRRLTLAKAPRKPATTHNAARRR